MTKSLTWKQYDAALKQRGSINFWISDEIENLWYDLSVNSLESNWKFYDIECQSHNDALIGIDQILFVFFVRNPCSYL